MPRKKKAEQKEFYTEQQVAEGKATKQDAPVVGGEFVTEDGEWQGQSVEVKSETKLEDDRGVGTEVIWRFFEFAANPEAFKEYEKSHGHMPYAQEIFQSHVKGIEAMLWQDGLRPIEEYPPRLILSKKKDRYLIHVAAEPSRGNVVVEKPKTLSEIANEGRKHTDKVPGVV